MLTDFPLETPSDCNRAIHWRLFCLSVALLLVVGLFVLGSLPMAAGLFSPPWDKLAHFILFSVLTGLLWIAAGGRAALAVIVMISLIGALDEWHQAGLPGRSADFTDFCTDVAAAAITVLVFRFRKR